MKLTELITYFVNFPVLFIGLIIIKYSSSNSKDSLDSKYNMIWKSNVNRELNGSGSCSDRSDPVIHKICHYKQMDDLGDHEPIPNIFRKKTTCLVCVQLSIGENPENDEKNTRYGLGCYKMGCVCLDIALLS